MSIAVKRLIIIAIVIIVAAVLGRLAVRAFMNLLLGGSLFEGNFLLSREESISYTLSL